MGYECVVFSFLHKDNHEIITKSSQIALTWNTIESSEYTQQQNPVDRVARMLSWECFWDKGEILSLWRFDGHSSEVPRAIPHNIQEDLVPATHAWSRNAGWNVCPQSKPWLLNMQHLVRSWRLHIIRNHLWRSFHP